MLLLAALVLGSAAWLRGAEYDEQYTLFLTSGTPRPDWPRTVFAAGTARAVLAGHADFASIGRDLRATDVHPPLYFWIVMLWRQVAGNGLFAARLLSVAFSLGALAAVGVIARQMAVPPALVMLLTLGCYGFVYTGAIARGFALAQLLTLLGVACGLRSQTASRIAAGLLFGMAVLSNYLAIFVALALIAWWLREDMGGNRNGGPERPQRPHPAAALAGLLPFVLVDVWFFVAQRGSRTGQFPPFHWLPSLARLLRYAAANVFGGLPLYVGANARIVVSAALAGVQLLLVALILRQWRARWLPLGLAALAPPIGLLVLGRIFDNTPIELRYLAFATPFLALLLAGVLASLPRVAGGATMTAVLLIQAAGIGGLLTRPETMQPARATARAAAKLVRDGVVLLPRGNDGVGIVGAFAIEAPPALRLLLVESDDTPERILARATPFERVVLALLPQDASSRTEVAAMQAALSAPGWRPVARGFNVIAYERATPGHAQGG